MLRTRQRGQAIVEFGIIAVLFAMILSAIIDFGLLLNTWLSVSGGASEVARSASVGRPYNRLEEQTRAITVLSVNDAFFLARGDDDCCDPTDAVSLRVEVFDRSCPDPLSCPLGNVPSTTPRIGDLLVTTVTAHAEAITPLARSLVFRCSSSDCVPLSGRVVTRYEGQTFTP